MAVGSSPIQTKTQGKGLMLCRNKQRSWIELYPLQITMQSKTHLQARVL
ncbi:hypothetical protein EV14_1359 [Prochlorococcus sp. MIT 0703]|nr:hypothetical protein EV14_1359 [Prochlorococcus sp. MIT 0703]